MGLSNRSILSVVELVYYGPALLLSAWVVVKHGHGRQLGWLYLTILCIIRIVGMSTALAANSNPTQGLIETSIICETIGLSPLFLAWLGIIKRVNEGMHTHQFPPLFIQHIHLPIVVGLVLAIFGGTDQFSSNPSTVSHGRTYSEVAIILFLVSLIALSVVSVVTFTRIRHVLDGEKRLVFATLASIPFLVVRILYSLIVDFDHNSSVFSFTSTSNAAVIVQAIMDVAMEFIVVALYITAGIATPAIPRSAVRGGSAPQSQHAAVENSNYNMPAYK